MNTDAKTILFPKLGGESPLKIDNMSRNCQDYVSIYETR